MCCIHNLHERLSIIFIQSINLLVFPLPPRFLSSSSDFLLPFPPLCLLLPQFLSSPSQKDHSRMPWAVRLKKVCEVTGIQNARTPTSAGKGITFVCSGNQAGRQAGIPMLGEPPVFIYSPLLSLSHTPRSLCLSLQKQWHWGTTPFPVVPTNDQLQRHEAALLPPPSHSSPFFFFFLGASVSHNHPKT